MQNLHGFLVVLVIAVRLMPVFFLACCLVVAFL
jgi:hypothetical protein